MCSLALDGCKQVNDTHVLNSIHFKHFILIFPNKTFHFVNISLFYKSYIFDILHVLSLLIIWNGTRHDHPPNLSNVWMGQNMIVCYGLCNQFGLSSVFEENCFH